MASGRIWKNICPECGKHIEILNGDFEFSMNLHNQSHKSLDFVNAIDKNLNSSTEKLGKDSKLKLIFCHECNDNFEMINNDTNLSLQLHAQRHKHDNTDTLSDHSSSSSKSKNSKPVLKEKGNQLAVTSILDGVFHTMPIGLQAHRYFISEKGCSKGFCNLCEIIIDPIFSVSEHLKTKLHEDNTLSVIKAIFPSELHDQMKFISFYGSNLCCNLCRSKIDLCSENIHKTVVNIFSHNAGKGHSSQRMTGEDCKQSDKALVILKSLALKNPIINENHHLVEYKIYPHFLCKPCDKQLLYSENENQMVTNLTKHFNSPGHMKYLSNVSLLTKWSTLNVTGKERHDFCVTKQKIHCLSCNTDVEANFDQLLSHVKKNSTVNEVGQSTVKATAVPNHNYFKSMNLSQTSNSVLGELSKEVFLESKLQESTNNPYLHQPPQTQDLSGKFKGLVQSLPIKFQNILTENEKGEVICSVCKCTIPPTTYNVTTHLEGASHKKKHSENKLSKKGINNPQSSRLIGAPGDHQPQKTICANKAAQSVQPKQAKDALVRELFNPIPMIFQKDMKYIKVMDGVNFVFCVICCMKIPRHTSSLLEHLEGSYHATVEKTAGIKKITELKPDDVQFKELLKSNKMIKAHSKYLSKTGDDYLCKPCKSTIKNSLDTDVLKRNILGHLNGKKHKKSVEDEFSTLLDKVQLKSIIVKNNRKFLKLVNDNILCTVCNCHMSKADCADTLKRGLEEHLKGSSHEKNLMTSDHRENNSLQPPEALNEMSRELEAIIAKLQPFTKPS